MKKEKYTLEFIFEKASLNSLWTRIATPTGLSEWFADEVDDISDRLFSFSWNKHTVEAEIIAINPNNYIRFRWTEEDPSTFFEFKLHRDELTGSLILEVTDFAEEDERENAIALWNSEISVLKRILGL